MSEHIIKRLLAEGYDKAYVWNAKPGEYDPHHSHSFDTKLIVIDGDILVEMDNERKTLKEGDEFEIPSQRTHVAKVGPSGCKYIVAEKH